MHILYLNGTTKTICITKEKISMDVHEIKIKKEDGKWSNSSNEMESQHHFPLQLETHIWQEQVNAATLCLYNRDENI